MTSTIYLDTVKKVARASITGTAQPSVPAKLLAHLKLIIKFFGADGVLAVDADTPTCVIKPKLAPTGAPSLIDTTAVSTGTGATSQYVFEWASADSTTLRALMDATGDPTQPVELRCEVEYELNGNLERIAFPIFFETSYTRPEDPAPEANTDSSWEWLKLRAPEANGFSHDDVERELTVAGGAGSGDVVGPASSVDSRPALFNGTTGKLLKQGSATLGDAAYKNTGTTAGTLAAGDDARMTNARTPTVHASTHLTGGADAIQAATSAQPGLATAAQITKLDGIEALADVTDAGNVGTAISGADAITTLADADKLPVTASGVLKNIAYSALKTLLDALYQAKSTILTTFSGLSNAAGVLTNNGSGTLSYTEISTGGGGASDNAKVSQFQGDGSLACSKTFNVVRGYSPASSGSINLQNTGLVYATIQPSPTMATPKTFTLGENSGTLAITADITPEGTAVKSTGETGGSKFLREDGDGTCSWQTIAGGGGSGDVVGPASSVDSRPALFDGTTGKLLKQGSAALGDAAYKNTGTTAGTLAAGDDARMTNTRTPTAHASTHLTGGADAIQAATSAQPGLATAAQITKLDGIEALADVTDAGNVGTAISGADAITTLADADKLPITASGVLKTLAYSALKTLLDALYAIKGAITGSGLTMSTARLLGRSTASSGAIEEITLGSGLTLTAGTLSATGGGGGSGDVVGPASSVDSRPALFDGTTGKLLKQGSATLGDAAYKNTGTTAGTVAAGDDARMTGAMMKSVYDSQNLGLITGLQGSGEIIGPGAFSGGNGGQLNMAGGNGGEFAAGSAGSINTSGGGGSGVTQAGGSGGNILTYGGDDGRMGGSIDTSNGGGSITTHNGGGSIATGGTGSIELGNSATRTTILGTATAARTVSFPDASGTLALLNGALGTPSSGTLTNCTGLPVAGITPSTSVALGVGSLNIGHASDTTLTRSSAGNLTIEGNLIYRAGGSFVGMPFEYSTAVSDETTALTAGTSKLTFRMPCAMTVTSVRASVGTAPTGSTLIVDIKENGTSILSTKLSIDATEKTSTTAATPAVLSDSALADDAEITIDIDQIGSTIAGAGLKVTLIGTRA